MYINTFVSHNSIPKENRSVNQNYTLTDTVKGENKPTERKAGVLNPPAE